MYNAWFGPLHFNREDFAQQWDICRGDVPLERSLLVGLFSFEKEYLRIELGEHQIENDRRHLFLVYFRHPALNQLLYTFHPMRASSTAPASKSFFVKLPTVLISHYYRRLSYRFERFSSETLMCILRQLAITYQSDGFDRIKSNCIPVIEGIYDRNATEFNMKVIQHTTFPRSMPPHLTRPTSRGYYSEFYSCGSFHRIQPLFVICSLEYFPSTIAVHVQEMLKRSGIPSVEVFDHLLLCILEENKHHNRLFIVQDRCLVLFKINLDEQDRNLLRHFNSEIPFLLIELSTIVEMSLTTITTSSQYQLREMPFTTLNIPIDEQTLLWLRQRLIHYNVRCQYIYEPRVSLASFIDVEEWIARSIHRSDLESRQNGIFPASPDFSARLRFEGPKVFPHPSSEIICSICREAMQQGEFYAQWACPAQRVLHYECMLNGLRRGHRCPLCRPAVPACAFVDPNTHVEE